MKLYNMKNRNTWAEEAEKGHEPLTYKHQGQDDVGHFNFYDGERLLSFQWDGNLEEPVTVSQGGYGEPVRWIFNYSDHVHPADIVNPSINMCELFAETCLNWIDATETAF